MVRSSFCALALVALLCADNLHTVRGCKSCSAGKYYSDNYGTDTCENCPSGKTSTAGCYVDNWGDDTSSCTTIPKPKCPSRSYDTGGVCKSGGSSQSMGGLTICRCYPGDTWSGSCAMQSNGVCCFQPGTSGSCSSGGSSSSGGSTSTSSTSTSYSTKSSGSTCSYNSQCSSGYCKVRHCSKTCVLQCARSDAQAVYSEAALLGRASLVTVVRV